MQCNPFFALFFSPPSLPSVVSVVPVALNLPFFKRHLQAPTICSEVTECVPGWTVPALQLLYLLGVRPRGHQNSSLALQVGLGQGLDPSSMDTGLLLLALTEVGCGPLGWGQRVFLVFLGVVAPPLWSPSMSCQLCQGQVQFLCG